MDEKLVSKIKVGKYFFLKIKLAAFLVFLTFLSLKFWDFFEYYNQFEKGDCLVFKDESIAKITQISKHQTTFQMKIIYLNSLSMKKIGEEISLTQEDIERARGTLVKCPQNEP
ncbi:MAG: hypothetical protein JNM93_13305 [Bacteriovoracaceae bacterium]|nr:hypothetical protein [Bacteriovoracaceae bacterium]